MGGGRSFPRDIDPDHRFPARVLLREFWGTPRGPSALVLDGFSGTAAGGGGGAPRSSQFQYLIAAPTGEHIRPQSSPTRPGTTAARKGRLSIPPSEPSPMPGGIFQPL